MTHESLVASDWDWTVERLGGAEKLAKSARETKAFLRAREVRSAADLLRLTLAYCLSPLGLRATTAWAAVMGVVEFSNVALLGRLRNTSDWLSRLIGDLLESNRPQAAKGRLIRILDATTVLKAGRKAKRSNKVWRVHGAFDLPAERFGFFELTDESGGERIDRVPVVPGEIRVGDRAYLQPDQLAEVIEAGADVLVRAGWRNARWLDREGEPLDLIAVLRGAAETGRVDQPVWIGCKAGKPLALRLIAIRKPPEAAAAARRQARQQARKGGHAISAGTLVAADWVILVTSLCSNAFPYEDVLKLYRLRWRIELAFKRLKSLIGLRSPPGEDLQIAKSWVLSHLMLILLTEPLIDELGVSPS